MMTVHSPAALAPGLADPVFDAQRIFRRVMAAMARPGQRVAIDVAVAPPVAGFAAAGAIALALLDFETPVWLPGDDEGQALGAWLRFHCGCPIAGEPQSAAFAFARHASLLPLNRYCAGDAKYPETAATLVITCPALEAGLPVILTGPGVAAPTRIAPAGFSVEFWQSLAATRQCFQLGVDVVLADDAGIIALPRSTRISLSGTAEE